MHGGEVRDEPRSGTRWRGMETRELMKTCRWKGWETGQMGAG